MRGVSVKILATILLLLASWSASARTWEYGRTLTYLVDKSNYLVSATITRGEMSRDGTTMQYSAHVEQKIYGALTQEKVTFSTWQPLEIGSKYVIFFEGRGGSSLNFMRALKVARGILGGNEAGIQFLSEAAVLIPSDLKLVPYVAHLCQGPEVNQGCADVVAFSYVPIDAFMNYVNSRRSRVRGE